MTKQSLPGTEDSDAKAQDCLIFCPLNAHLGAGLHNCRLKDEHDLLRLARRDQSRPFLAVEATLMAVPSSIQPVPTGGTSLAASVNILDWPSFDKPDFKPSIFLGPWKT